MTDMIRRVVTQAALDASDYEAGARKVQAANTALGQSVEKAGAAITSAKVSLKDFITVGDLEKRLDPLARAEDRIAAATARHAKEVASLNGHLAGGSVTIQRHGELIAAADAKYAGFVQKVRAAADAQSRFAGMTTTQVSAALDTGARGTSRYGAALQQAAFQVGDFAVQVGAGQSALVAFSQQGSQLLGFFGPFGAAAGAAVAIIGGLAGGFLRSADGATEAAKATDLYADAIKASQQLTLDQTAASIASADAKRREAQETIQSALAVETETYARANLAKVLLEADADRLRREQGFLPQTANTDFMAEPRARANKTLAETQGRVTALLAEFAKLENPVPGSVIFGELHPEIEKTRKATEDLAEAQAQYAKDVRADEERELKPRRDALATVEQQIAGYEAESAALRMSERDAEIYRAGLKAENELRKAGIDLLSGEAAWRVEAAKGAAANLYDARAAKKANEERQKDYLKSVEAAEKERERIARPILDELPAAVLASPDFVTLLEEALQ